MVTQYIAFLSLRQYAHSTASLHISAISYYNKINNLEDCTLNYIVRQMLQGFKRSRKTSDSRLPISPAVLKLLLKNLRHVCRSQYEETLFAAAFSFAYMALLRVSEFALPNPNQNKVLFVTRMLVLVKNL